MMDGTEQDLKKTSGATTLSTGRSFVVLYALMIVDQVFASQIEILCSYMIVHGVLHQCLRRYPVTACHQSCISHSISVLVNLYNLLNSFIRWDVNLVLIRHLLRQETPSHKMSPVEVFHQRLRRRQTHQRSRP